ncbi:hypothetical protein IHE29_04990 [Mycetohabitans rhizoxinica]|uniref:Uncharacterized protein n=1 Tax=Mycetohabitans rhizoxinica TaxID=412963 RepID=A0ABZ2Q207_9BURK|nr:DUF6723 family protein [Mycetohabitans sp. B6]MCG1047860.1 hypothetical protein [Mycetohabitans sp. B6]
MQYNTPQAGRQQPGAEAPWSEGFKVLVTAKPGVDGRFIGMLKVVRQADRRVIFPFPGAPEIGPFDTIEQARAAALEYGRKVVADDRRNPER